MLNMIAVLAISKISFIKRKRFRKKAFNKAKGNILG